MEPFDCGNYRVTIKNEEVNKISFTRVDKDICDIYSEEQNITFENDKDIYELKFNVVSYNQEILIFEDNVFLDKCKSQNNMLVCPLT